MYSCEWLCRYIYIRGHVHCFARRLMMPLTRPWVAMKVRPAFEVDRKVGDKLQETIGKWGICVHKQNRHSAFKHAFVALNCCMSRDLLHIFCLHVQISAVSIFCPKSFVHAYLTMVVRAGSYDLLNLYIYTTDSQFNFLTRKTVV